MEQKKDFEIVNAPPEPDLSGKSSEEIDEGIQTSSISKESSLQYFVKKIEESKETSKQLPVVDATESYQKFEKVEKQKTGETPLTTVIQPEIITTKEVQHQTVKDFQLIPEPPACIYYSEPVSSMTEKIRTIPVVQEKEVKKITEIQTPKPVSSSQSVIELKKTEKIEGSTPIFDSQSYEQKINITQDLSISTNYEKFTRGMSPRPEALEMEKLWIPKKELERPLSVTDNILPDKPSHVRSYSYSERDYSTETPKIQYVANVSTCLEPCEKKIENLYTTTERYEKFEQVGMKSEHVVEEQNVKPSQVLKDWKPIKVQPPLFKPPPSMEHSTIRPPSVQEITSEVFLEPGPPPIIDYAEPPKRRRQSYVETVEQELEAKLETVPSRVPPGGVRTIPPPPPPKVVPPPLPPKNEQSVAPPLPAKPIKTDFKEKIIEIKPKIELNLEPFPFKPDPVKTKPTKGGPPPTPSRFIKGKFTDSDYESDFESVRIPPKWKPCASDNEEPSYRIVRPPKVKESQRSRSTEPEPLPPSKFDQPPQFQGPPRPNISIERQKKMTQTTFKKSVQQSSTPKETVICSPPIKPGTPPLYIEVPAKKVDSPKVKRTFNDGYMADTDEPFFQQKSGKSETHEVGTNFSRYEYKSENFVQSSQTCVSTTPSAPKISQPKKPIPHAPVPKKVS